MFLVQIAVVILGLIGLILQHNVWIVAGVVGVVVDGYGAITGKGNPTVPISFYLLGAVVSLLTTGQVWYGILAAAIVSQAFDVLPVHIPPLAILAMAWMGLVTFIQMGLLAAVFPRMRTPFAERLLTCESCGAEGYQTYATVEPKRFRPQGNLQGQVVMRCLACNGGQLYSISNGLAFGKPRLIPDSLWAAMCEEWRTRNPAAE